jgi:hypothetical protein
MDAWNRPNDSRGDAKWKPQLKYGEVSVFMKQFQVNGDPNHPDVYVKSVEPVPQKKKNK